MPADPSAFDDELLGPPLRGVIEVDWDGWDDDATRSRAAWIVGVALAVLAVAVAVLVVRAVNTDAELSPPPADVVDGTPAADGSAADAGPPTLDELAALLPAGLEGCVPDAQQPTDGSVRMACPRPQPPELVTFTLFPDEAARDQAFEDAVTTLELDAARRGECALSDDVVHDYVTERGRGQVACRHAGDRIDLVWTDAAAPVLGTTGGYGAHADHYRFWSQLVARHDDAFPLRVEQELLDRVPHELRARCRRDLELLEASAGQVAVTCEPATGAAETVSWVRFADADAMAAWFDGWALTRTSGTADGSAGACRPGGAGPEGQLPVPWYGTDAFDLEGSTGRVLCAVGEDGRNVLVWTRAGTNIGSVADSDASMPGSMVELLWWWEDGGHRP